MSYHMRAMSSRLTYRRLLVKKTTALSMLFVIVSETYPRQVSSAETFKQDYSFHTMGSH